MKVVILALVLGVALAENIPLRDLTAYDYHTRVGIPRAIALMKAEQNAVAGGAGRIVGGQVTDISQVPYQVGLVITILWILTSVCGGTIISPNTILTAAHCHHDGRFTSQSMTVVAGSNMIFSGGQRLVADSVIMHHGWDPLNHISNDIGILKVSGFTMTNSVRPCPIATMTQSAAVGQMAQASGFGLTRDGGSISQQQVLSSVELPVISNAQCELTYGTAITNTHICTSGEGNSSVCSGDSGGPLTIIEDGIRKVIGVVSFGHVNGCELGYNQGYSHAPSFQPWINQHL